MGEVFNSEEWCAPLENEKVQCDVLGDTSTRGFAYEMISEGFRKKLLQRLNAVEGERIAEEAARKKRTPRAKGIEWSAWRKSTALDAKRRFRSGFAVIACLMISALAERLTGIPFFFWYIPLSIISLYDLCRRLDTTLNPKGRK